MKKILLMFFIFCVGNCYGQAGMWTWISGTNTTGSAGVYGTQGIPSVNNHPPGLYEYCEWKDKQGNFWLYGGFDSTYSDLWKYEPLTNEWTWVKGNGLTSQPPLYGTKGVPNIANTPGERPYCAATWVDTTGNLWLFGADLYRNDLWNYNISTNEWTWINGSDVFNAPGVHGTQGIPGALNVPGARDETCSAWTDSLNNLWLFGGFGYDEAGSYGYLNDLMKYNISTNEWTWMKGSALVNASRSYGSIGIPNAANDPGARMSWTKWKDTQGNFWLMGGYISGLSNDDVWKYDANTNVWTWMAGTNTTSDSGVYQANCIYNTINRPASRIEQRSAVTDNCGRFWLFGGAHASTYLYLNDLWVFNPALAEWNWVSGTNIPNQPGNYGVLGVPAATNIPPSRWGASAWWGNDNRFYLFGGSQDNIAPNYSDLWVFTPDTLCVGSCLIIPSSVFSATPNILCPGTCTSFLNLSTNATSYQWSFPGATPDTSTATNPTTICYQNSGSYDVQLIATNANGSDTLLLSNYITVYPAPPPQGIAQSGDTLFANAGATTYQWYYNTTLITGATNYFYVAPQSGDYNVVATDMNGCEVEAAIFNVVASAQFDVSGLRFEVYPNPVEEMLYVKSYMLNGAAVEITIYNMLGVAVRLRTPNSKLPAELDVRALPQGMYWIEVASGDKVFRSKFVKQ